MSAYPKPCDNCERVTSGRAVCLACGSAVALCDRCSHVAPPRSCDKCPALDCVCGDDHDCRATGCADECEACNA